MLALVVALALTQDPASLGPDGIYSTAAALDYSTGFLISGFSNCTNGAYTTDQGGAISVTRATTAICESTPGTLTTISANKLVVEFNGMRAEAASSNRNPQSEGIDTNWTPTNASAGTNTVVGPLGVNVNNLQTTSSGGFYQSPTFTIAATSAVLSIWTRSASGTQGVNAILRDTTANVDRCTITNTAPTSWVAMASRPSCSSASITSGNNHVVRVYPGGTAGSSSGNVYFWGAQVEPGITTMTSYIPTAGAAVTRNADNVSLTQAGIAASGCFSATILATAPNFPQKIATNPDTIAGYNNTASVFANDGTNTTNSNNVANMTGLSTTVRVLWGGTAIQLGLNGSLGASGTFDGSMGSGTTFYLGSNGGASQFMNGWIKNIKIGTSNTGCGP